MIYRCLLWLGLLSAIFGCIALPRTCHADDTIGTVTLDVSGPDRNLPFGREFYLTGEVGADYNKVYVVIVRTSWPWFNLYSGDQNRCSELQGRVAPPFEDEKKRKFGKAL